MYDYSNNTLMSQHGIFWIPLFVFKLSTQYPYSSQFFEYSVKNTVIGHTLIDHNAWSKKFLKNDIFTAALPGFGFPIFWKTFTYLSFTCFLSKLCRPNEWKRLRLINETVLAAKSYLPVSQQLQIGSPVVWIGWTWGVVGTTWRQLRPRSTVPAPPSPLAATPGTRLPPVLGTSTWITA